PDRSAQVARGKLVELGEQFADESERHDDLVRADAEARAYVALAAHSWHHALSVCRVRLRGAHVACDAARAGRDADRAELVGNVMREVAGADEPLHERPVRDQRG